jgi:hypothetical protein
MSPRLVYRPLRWHPTDTAYVFPEDTVTLCDDVPSIHGVRGKRSEVYVEGEDGRGMAVGRDEIVWTCDHELLAALSTMVTREVDARCRDCGALVRIGCEDRPVGYVDGEKAA